MKSINDIKWPNEIEERKRLYISFMLKVLEPYGRFLFEDGRNPCLVAERFLSGEISKSEYENEVSDWWRVLEKAGSLGVPRNSSEVSARLAICLLSVKDDSDLGEHLSWFLEVLYMFKPNVQDSAIEKMQAVFSFK